MFIIAAVISCIGGVFNVVLLDANIQPWAKIDENLKKNAIDTTISSNGVVNESCTSVGEKNMESFSIDSTSSKKTSTSTLP